MTTYEQERNALEKIKRIVDGLGKDSSVGEAFSKCIESVEAEEAETMSAKIRPKDVAAVLGINAQAVRVGLQRGIFPFGWAIKTSSNRYTYAISPKLFEKYLGERKFPSIATEEGNT